MAPIPELPAISRSQLLLTPLASGVTSPSPVTTTLLILPMTLEAALRARRVSAGAEDAA
jgi:hypothetical protein